MKLEGANPDSAATGLDEVPGRANYFIGNDPKKWKPDVPTFARVKYTGVYPGVDLIYYGSQRQLEYDFIVAPGADPGSIRLAIDGAKSIRIDRSGDLVLKLPGDEIRLRQPVVYQSSAANSHTPVDCRYVLRAHHRVGFRLGPYDPAKPLVIDPVVTFATYLGGAKDITGQPAVTDGYGIAVDPHNNVYVTGTTTSVNDGVFPIFNAQFPAPPTTTQSCPPGKLNAFVAKLDSAGNRVYVTYLGGTNCNNGISIAADGNGNAFATGFTESTDFPVTTGAFQSTKPSPGIQLASYLTEFDPAGHLAYSTYIAAGSGDYVAVDGANNFYLTGDTDATFSNRTTPGAFLATCSTNDTFILKFSPAAVPLYASCLGSSTGGGAITVDSSGNIYIAGTAYPGTNFAAKQGFQTTVAGGLEDVFLAKLFPGGNSQNDLLYSTFFGGTGEDYAVGIAVDNAGNAYMAGETGSGDLPVTLTTIHPACVPRSVGTCTGWVAEVNTTASGAASRVFATYLGGSSGDDSTSGIVFDATTRNAFVAGYTASGDFPTVNPIYGCPGCANFDESMFVTEFSPAGAILFCTFLGGSAHGDDEALAVAIDSSGTLYLTGETGSESLPPIPTAPPAIPIAACMNPLQPTEVGGLDAFVVKLAPGEGTQSTTTCISSSADPSVFGQTVTFTATVNAVVCTSGNPTGTVTFFDGATNLGSQTLTNNVAIFSTSALSIGNHSITASYAGDPNFTASTSLPFVEQIMVLPPTISKAFGAAAIVQAFSTSLSFTIANPNPLTPLSSVGFVDNLPAGLVITTPNGLTGSCGGGVVSAVGGSSTVSLAAATLAAGGACTFSVNVTGTAAGVFTNTAQNVTSSNGGNGNPASAGITVLPALVTLNVAESIKVTDTELVPSVFINLAETIKVTDAPAIYNTPTASNIAVQPVFTDRTRIACNAFQPGLSRLHSSLNKSGRFPYYLV